MTAVAAVTALPVPPVVPIVARVLPSPGAPVVDENALLGFLQRTADSAVTWLADVSWAAVVLALDTEPFVAVGSAVPGWADECTPWPGVAVPGHGASLLLSTPVLVGGRPAASLVLGGTGRLDDEAVEVAEDLARSVGALLDVAARRGRRRVADELRFALLARAGRGSGCAIRDLNPEPAD